VRSRSSIPNKPQVMSVQLVTSGGARSSWTLFQRPP
jgi:hypothetical protein